jgi:lipoate-protein ligase A
MSSDTCSWRLLISEPLSGPENMALDEAIMESVGAGLVRPTLRLYAWHPSCLSLGYAQPVADVNHAALVEHGWDLVRRPTGGRAILHTDELTYAIVAPADHPELQGGVLESYRRLRRGLAAALAGLGLVVDPAHGEPLSAESRANPVCFEVPSAYEITVRGFKLLGSAQVRRRDAILQHGTLPLAGDLSRVCLVLRHENLTSREKARERLLERAATLESLLGEPVRWNHAARAIQAGFEGELGWHFERGVLLQRELDRADVLAAERYRSQVWTERI